MTYGTYTPISYPSVRSSFDDSSFEILLKTIKSYSGINFKAAFFRVIIDAEDECTKIDLLERLTFEIDSNINSDYTNIQAKRPSCKNEWFLFIDECSSHISSEPVLVSMNHDHVMVEENKFAFIYLASHIHSFLPNCLLTYSHIPEAISWGMGGLAKKHYSASELNQFGLIKNISSEWLDCIYLMSLGQLKYIFSSIKYAPDYLPRFDWADVKFKKMDINVAVVPISFFRHYDGYGHITGIRTSRLFSEDVLLRLNSSEEIISYAYREYVEIFYIYFRDSLAACKFKGRKRKEFFVSISEQCFNIFLNSNLKTKYQSKIGEDQVLSVLQEIRELFYYDFNLIYGVIQEDARLNSRFGPVNRIRNFAKRVLSTLLGRVCTFELR